ncbi:FapA family protein [Clostridium sp.]|uniref:DUF342 domain-containing protein n=1 Tax=Clostridium sp. TaxID=1506 RepID=UPI00284C76F0|nr:FapA family protein [Clostridium sp.]MDR3593962.1 FapA family protein [Clostridium sp.]
MSLKFSAASLGECLEKASFELNIPKGDLKYTIIREEKRFFKKIVEIEILEAEDSKASVEEEEIVGKKEEKTELFGAKVEGAEIIVTESPKQDEIITIKACPGVILYINGQISEQITPVSSQDKIEYKFEELEPTRSAEIQITNDRMEAYVNVRAIPVHVYKLLDKGYHKNLTLEKKKVEDKYPPKYTSNELQELLQSKGIRYGIIKQAIEDASGQYNAEDVLVAKGLPAQDDISDEIQVLFKESEELKEYEDTNNKVDFRKRFLIANVKAGDIIGKIILGTTGSDGQDIFGVPIKRKTWKKAVVKIGDGCRLEDNTVIATSEGKPAFKSNTFSVNKLYKVDQVDLKSGNIDFVGNVEVTGAVLEGMEVKAGNELHIGKNVESATVKSSGEIAINGNVLHSKITAGSENVERRQYLENLINYKSIIEDLRSSTEQVKVNKLLGERKDGEIIKILIENKFKLLPNLSRSVLNYNMSQGVQHSELVAFIINKLIGLGPLKMESYKELCEFEQMLKEEIDEIEELIVIPADIYIEYAQGTDIEASGSVYITGKGQYICNITALNKIEFTNEKAVCRGGTLYAGSEIRLKTVGSEAGVNTILKVSKKGRIFADIAYYNTVFCFGEKQMTLEISAKNVEAYLDKDGDITIDKFVL